MPLTRCERSSSVGAAAEVTMKCEPKETPLAIETDFVAGATACGHQYRARLHRLVGRTAANRSLDPWAERVARPCDVEDAGSHSGGIGNGRGDHCEPDVLYCFVSL